MAFRLSHSLQDAFRYAMRSRKTEVGARIRLNIFDHRSAFTDTTVRPVPLLHNATAMSASGSNFFIIV
jgi:hypothetical protein